MYPRFKDGIGFPQTVDAYSREKGKSPNTQRGSHGEQAAGGGGAVRKGVAILFNRNGSI